MATYTMLQNGSRGDEVKKLQQSLVDAGYNVGSAGVDGIYGSATAAAVKKYQQDNGLDVDGIAGDQTLGSLYKPKQSEPANTPTGNATPEAAAPDYSKYQYDPGANEAYQQALAALQQAQQQLPTYQGTYDQQLQDIYQQIVNRKPFTYNVNEDALYQQYKDQYVTQGRLAMMDTMGQAAALTGGYGNSYGQAVGQQQYQAYLQQLNDVVPELYGMALDQYNQEGQDMLNQYGMVGDMADTEYGRYQDALNQYWQNLSYQKQLADDAYDQGYNNWYNAYQMGTDAENTAYAKQQDAYDRIVSLITSTGYTPTAAELQAAGMSQAQAKAYADYYNQQNAGRSTGNSTGSNPGSVYDNSSISNSKVKDIQKALGVTADGLWGPDSEAAAKQKWGVSSAEDAWNYYTTKVRVPGGPVDTRGDNNSVGNPVDTENTQLFRGSIMNRQEFASHGNRATVKGKTYTSYKSYIEACLADWTDNDVPYLGKKLTDDEVNFLMDYYGL